MPAAQRSSLITRITTCPPSIVGAAGTIHTPNSTVFFCSSVAWLDLRVFPLALSWRFAIISFYFTGPRVQRDNAVGGLGGRQEPPGGVRG